MIVTRLIGPFAAVMLAAACLAWAPPARAELEAPGLTRPTSQFHLLDADKDGRVTFDEFAAYRDGVIWKIYDPLNTGQASRRAFIRGQHSAVAFARLDVNGNKMLEKSEFDVETRRLFESRDKNGDGVLTADEFRPARRSLFG